MKLLIKIKDCVLQYSNVEEIKKELYHINIKLKADCTIKTAYGQSPSAQEVINRYNMCSKMFQHIYAADIADILFIK